MISTSARVISVTNGSAQIEPDQQSACNSCQSRSACGVSGLGKYFSANRKTIDVACDANVRAGDELQLSMSEGDLIRAGLLAYLLPVVLALTGSGIAALFGSGDAGAALGALMGFAAGLLILRLSNWVPRLVAMKKNDYLTEGETP